MIREQLTEFCGRVFCLPRTGVDDMTDVFDRASEQAINESFVFHAGTNAIRTTRSEKLLCKYCRLMQQYKTKSNNILISGARPRFEADNIFYSEGFSINNRLKTLQ